MKNPRNLNDSGGFRVAGAEGFEPSTKVLETHVLPLHHAPIAFATVALYEKTHHFVKVFFILPLSLSSCLFSLSFIYFLYTVSGGDNMQENKLIEMSMNFSVSVLKLTETIKGHYSLVNQLEKSATSIGANIHESCYAQSKSDFISKLQIALKECHETKYWLDLFTRASVCEFDTLQKLRNECDTIRRILVSSINTAKSNQ